MAKGDHILVSMGIYTHHGIDMGDGTVVHWSTSQSDAKTLSNKPALKASAIISRTSLALFSGGKEVWVRQYRRRFDPDTVAARALRCIGVTGYDVFRNNCEHFATLCKTGRHRSEQVEDLPAKLVRILLLAPVLVPQLLFFSI